MINSITLQLHFHLKIQNDSNTYNTYNIRSTSYLSSFSILVASGNFCMRAKWLCKGTKQKAGSTIRYLSERVIGIITRCLRGRNQFGGADPVNLWRSGRSSSDSRRSSRPSPPVGRPPLRIRL